MKVTNEKTENSQAFLTIEMEPTEVEESLEKSYHRLVKRTRVPGFRVGKAPRAILERYLGKERLLEDAFNDLLPQACEKAIKEQEIVAIARPQIEITQTTPLVFKAIVPLKPQVKLGDYHQIQVASEPVVVTEGDVSQTMEQLRHRYATWESVERPVDFGDLVVLDIESRLEDKPFINEKGAQYQLLRDSSLPVPGFAGQLVGMKKDEERDFKLQFPPDDPRSELAGKVPWFKVKVTDVKQEMLPEVNDEFARQVNPDFKTLLLLQEQVSSELKLNAGEKTRADFEERLVDALVGLAEVEFPPVLVEAEINRVLNQRFPRGNQELAEYLRSVGKTEAELHEELHPLATKRVTRSLVLGKVAEEEKIEVSDAEIDGEIDNMTKDATKNKDDLEQLLNTPAARQSIKQTILTRKTFARLTEIAQGSTEIKTEVKEGKA